MKTNYLASTTELHYILRELLSCSRTWNVYLPTIPPIILMHIYHQFKKLESSFSPQPFHRYRNHIPYHVHSKRRREWCKTKYIHELMITPNHHK